MRNFKKIKKWVAEVTEISLLAVAFGIVFEILFGSTVPLFDEIIPNIVGLLGTLGENGLVGLVALGFVIYLFQRSKALA